MDAQTEQWLKDTLGPAHNYYVAVDAREHDADKRTEAIIKAVQDGFRKMAEAHERGLKDIAAAIRDSRR